MKLQDNSKRKLPSYRSSYSNPVRVKQEVTTNAIFRRGDVDITGMTVDELLAVQDRGDCSRS